MRSKTKRRFEVNQRTAQPPVPGGTFWRKKTRKKNADWLGLRWKKKSSREERRKKGRKGEKQIAFGGLWYCNRRHSTLTHRGDLKLEGKKEKKKPRRMERALVEG